MPDFPIKVTLTIVEGVQEGLEFELSKKRTVLGRVKADILLKDKKVSGTHAVLEIDGKDLFVEDLNSTNGTYLNDKRITQREKVRNMDEIVLGYTRIRVHVFENLDYFKKVNLQSLTQRRTPPERPDIGKMIEEELAKFSRWDIASEEEAAVDRKAQPPKQRVVLEFIEGPEEGKRVVLTKGSTSIGRGKVDVRIKDPDVSRNHALIECYGRNEYYIIDQASTNGTYVNDKKVVKAKLNSGDKVQVGGSVFNFLIED